jgi:hypothetical protein
MSQLVSYKGDHNSIVTVHTLLHIVTGCVVGLIAQEWALGAQSSALAMMAVALGWEVFEYWHAPAFGYWTVMNAGNTAVDIASSLWAFMAVHDVGWDYGTFWLIVPGIWLGVMVRCKPYEEVSTQAYSGRSRGCLTYMMKARASVYPSLEGLKDFTQHTPLRLDPYMAPSQAHWVLASISLCAMVLCIWVPEQAVPSLATFVFGYALGGPSITYAGVYDDWYLAGSLELTHEPLKL